MTDDAPGCQLYLVTPPVIDIPVFTPLLSRALGAAPVASLLLQLDSKDEADWRRAIGALLPVAQDAGTAFILARRADLAHEYGADGVELGSSDIPVADARSLLGEDAIIGAICGHSRHAAMAQGEAGADYISFGPFFEGGKTADILGWWHELMEVPAVAFGSITPENAPDISAIADFLRPSPALWQEADIERAIRAYAAAIED
ncbi:MAG TPA: thiamine phosphate synthase [Patescibacteria group bacterium]|nr:thiamine phosphate synthase [Patescibacteria group bacterium]